MSYHQPWQRVGHSTVEVYGNDLVPAMFAPLVPALLDLAGLQPGERVLDVACGTGVVALAAAERAGATGWVAGLDLNEAMLAMARSLSPDSGAAIEWIAADALAMPLPDASFDVVLCQHGLQQIPDRPAALAEMRRVLAPGGRLVVSVWNRIERNPGMQALAEALERHLGPEAARNRRAPCALGDPDRLSDLLTAAGFTEVTVTTLAGTGRFPSPDAFVDYQLAATPITTLGEIPDAVRDAIRRDVRAALQPYISDDRFALPLEAVAARGRR